MQSCACLCTRNECGYKHAAAGAQQDDECSSSHGPQSPRSRTAEWHVTFIRVLSKINGDPAAAHLHGFLTASYHRSNPVFSPSTASIRASSATATTRSAGVSAVTAAAIVAAAAAVPATAAVTAAVPAATAMPATAAVTATIVIIAIVIIAAAVDTIILSSSAVSNCVRAVLSPQATSHTGPSDIARWQLHSTSYTVLACLTTATTAAIVAATAAVASSTTVKAFQRKCYTEHVSSCYHFSAIKCSTGFVH
eukprot:16689-Heterococcus_DN1.PRE.16